MERSFLGPPAKGTSVVVQLSLHAPVLMQLHEPNAPLQQDDEWMYFIAQAREPGHTRSASTQEDWKQSNILDEAQVVWLAQKNKFRSLLKRML